VTNLRVWCSPMKARPSYQMIIDQDVIGHSASVGERVAAVTALTGTAHQWAVRSPGFSGHLVHCD
jgi:hypothetical protein